MKPLLLTLVLALCASPAVAQGKGPTPWNLFAQRDYAKALVALEGEARNYPNWEVVHDAIGWCHYFLGDYAKAEAGFQKALAIRPNYSWSLDGMKAIEAQRAAPLAAAQELLSKARYLEARAEFQRIHEGQTPAAANAIPDALLGEAWSLYGLGAFEDAIGAFRKALKLRKDWLEAYRGIAYCEYAQGHWRDALVALERSFAGGDKDLTARMTAGWCHYWLDQYGKGLENFLLVKESAPEDARGWFGSAWCRLRQGQEAEALEEFEQAVRLSPWSMTADLRALIDTRASWVSLHELAGWSALRAHLDSLAEQEFETARRLTPSAIMPQAGLAFTAFRLGSMDRAHHLAEALVDMAAPASFPITTAEGRVLEVEMNMRSLMGWCAYRLGRYDDALANFRAVRQGQPDWVDPICGEGWVLFTQGNYPAAEKAFLDALALEPGYPEAQSGAEAVRAWRYSDYDSAWNEYYEGRISDAAAGFQSILKHSGLRFPVESEYLLHASLGWCYDRLGRREEARLAFKDALNRAPTSSLALRGLARMDAADEDWSSAVRHLEAALMDPALAQSADLLAELGWARVGLGEMQAAAEVFRKALASDGRSAAALAGIGACELSQDKKLEARLSWERALSIDPTLASRGDLEEQMEKDAELQKLHVVLGWAWLARGELQKAEQQFQLASERDPHEPTVARGLGLAQVRQGKLDESLQRLEKWLSAQPPKENPWGVQSATLSEVAWALLSANRTADAIKVFERLAGLHSKEKVQYADPFDGLGWCFIAQGKADRARKEFLAAIAIEPRYEHSLQGLERAREIEQ